MQLRYEEDLIEAAVFLCTSGHRKGVPSRQIARFHRERERLYGILDPDERNTAFFKLHLIWFREWGMEKVLGDLLNEFPLLRETLSVLVVRKIRGRNDEGAELYVTETGRRSAILALRPESFQCNAELQDSVRHEFMHLRDMLDPGFGYAPVLDLPGLNGAQRRLANERYRLLWDITIDGRLAASSHKPARSREQHQAVFTRAFCFWPEDRQRNTFQALWHNAAPSHSVFLVLIDDPRGLRGAHRPAPGAACPLCDFPTFAWAEVETLSPEMTLQVQAEFPGWTLEHGLCSRCLEAYQASAGLSKPPVLVAQGVHERGSPSFQPP